MKENLEKLINFVNPENLKGNLICCSLYIAFFEATKDYITEQPKGFYSTGFCSETGIIVDPQYKCKVLSKDDRSVAKASLLWFVEQGAITLKDVEIFDELRKYRNVLVHEMFQRLYDGLDETFSKNFVSLIEFRLKIERWWVFNIEIPTSDIDPETIIEDEVLTGSQIWYRLVLDVLSEDEEKAKFYHSEFLKYKYNLKTP